MPSNKRLEQLNALVSLFSVNIAQYKSGKDGEAGGHDSFIDRLFTLLGLDNAGNTTDKSLKILCKKFGRFLDQGDDAHAPQYIIDFIVQNTVGEKVKDKTPQEISGIRICDPACGSGAFLVGAYRCLLDYHLNYYAQDKNLNNALKERKIQETASKSHKLTMEEKRRILVNNIYGVDIDPQAVEITRLSLHLKLLENEDDAAKTPPSDPSGATPLPSLENNIKCGNSLIGTDFLAQPKLKLSGDDRLRINCFDWEQEFGQRSLRTDTDFTGLFDVVIGDPPFGAALTKLELNYLERKFNAGNTDTAALFLLHARKLSKAFGKNGFIVPKAFTYAPNWQTVRYIVFPDIEKIADCGKLWQTVKLETSVYINQMNNTNDYFDEYKRNDTLIEKTETKKRNLREEFNLILNGVSDKETELGLKIKHNNKTLNDYIKNIRGGAFQADVSATGSVKVLGGKQMARYGATFELKGKINKSLLADDPDSFIAEDSILVQNSIALVKKPKPHINIIATLPPVPAKQYAILDTVSQLINNSEISTQFILGVLNSKLVSWYAYRFIFANAAQTMRFDGATTAKIPFPAINLSKKADKAKHGNLVSLVGEMLSKQTEEADAAIDTAVYKLYDLMEDEIKLIEELF